MTQLDGDLLSILACPKCRAPVEQKADTVCCTDNKCALAYPIRDGIPIMLVDEASSPSDLVRPDGRSKS